MEWAILPFDLMQCAVADQQYCDAFNFYFNLMMSVGVYVIPLFAAIRLVSRS